MIMHYVAKRIHLNVQKKKATVGKLTEGIILGERSRPLLGEMCWMYGR